LNQFLTIFKSDNGLSHFFYTRSILMIESIEFRQGVLSLTVIATRSGVSSECKRSIEFDFGERGAVPELHRGELMDFLYTVHPENAYEIGDMVFKLLGAQSRVRRIYLDCLYRSSESLEGAATPDVLVEFPDSAVEGAGSDKQVPPSLCESPFD
jgi:hypothetical protein